MQRKAHQICPQMQLGSVSENTDSGKYRSALIYQATIEEDREKTWNNKEAWKAQMMTGIDLIDKVLKREGRFLRS